MHFGTAVGSRYAIPKVAFNEDFHEFAPGQLLIWAVLEDLLARGFTEFDFLGDSKPWKEEWTDQVRVHHRAHIFNTTVMGRLASVMRYEAAPRVKRLARKTPAFAVLFGS
jgi:CelD/BcsL family acetyltransferase involved in cellulose biosynthesis